MPSIEITATSTIQEPIVSVLAGNLDFGEVVVHQQIFAVKALIPLEILITVPTGFLLTKFLLEPMIGPVAEKWKKTVAHHLHPLTPFNLTITVTEENLVYEASLGTKHQLTANIWDTVQQAVDILKIANRLKSVSKVKFMPGESNELLIFCYEEGKPTFFVDLQREKVTDIPADKMPMAIEPEASADSFMETVEAMALAHRQGIQGIEEMRQKGK